MKPSTTFTLLILILALMPASRGPAGAQADLGSAQLQIAGTRLVIDNPSQTVPFNTPTLVNQHLEGYDPALGTLPTDLRVLGDLRGPEVDGVLVLETVPNEPFRIPALRLEGDYTLSEVRLVQGETLLAHAEPREATILVSQVLVTKVSSRALTLQEIRALGLAIDEDSFSAYNLTFGIGVEGETVEYNMPLVRNAYGPNVRWAPLEQVVKLPTFGGATVRTKNFSPMRLIPFAVDLEVPEKKKIPRGGCDPRGECRPDDPPDFPTVGVILFPTDVSLLHQYFSVVLMVQNGAPAGDLLEVRDLVAKILLPTGLKLRDTKPPVVLGRPVPIQDAGPDGEIDTADDIRVIVAQATGQADFTVEGVREGTHVVHFQMEGMLDGLPTGPRRITGEAKGAVAVRDPNLSVRLSHPEVVRADVDYSIFMTVANIGTAPVNLISLKLPEHAMSGARIADGDSASKSIESLDPGDAETVEFRLTSLRTGRVVSTSMRSPSMIDPSIEYSVRVGEPGSLSPDLLSLPRSSEELPRDFLDPALGLVGLGYSMAEAPPALGSGLPRVSMHEVNERIYRLSQAGTHFGFGESLFDVTATLASEWNGARDGSGYWNWDELRRKVKKGGEVAAGFAAVLTQESTSSLDAFERFAATTHYLGQQAVLAEGSGAVLEVASRTSGKAVAGGGDDPARLRDLPFGELYDLHPGTAGAGQMALLSVPEEGGYEARLRHPNGGTADLHLLVPDDGGVPRVARFAGVTLSASGLATVSFQKSDTVFTLDVDGDGDGVAESQIAGTVDTLAPRPFQVIAAVQNADVDPTSHVVDVVFTEDVNLESLYPRDPDHFVVPGNVSNGGMVEAEADLVGGLLSGNATVENPLEGLSNPRLVRVVFERPLSPLLADRPLTVSGLESAFGQSLAPQTMAPQTVQIEIPPGHQPGIMVRGKVFGTDGEAVAGATVALIESDIVSDGFVTLCDTHTSDAVTTDANGEFFFPYVRQSECGDVFKIKAQDPASGAFGEASGRVRLIGQELELNVLMPQRGSLTGSVRYDDGSPVTDPRVIASSREFDMGRIASVDENGVYRADGVVVGTVTLAADDGLGNHVLKTVELPTSGAVVEQDLVIPRRDDEPAPGRVRGTVKAAGSLEPIFDAFVGIYLDGALIEVAKTGLDGTFDLGLVPSGITEIRVFSGASLVTGAAAAVFHLEVFPDKSEDLELLLEDDVSTLEGHVYSRHWSGSLTPIEGAVVWIRNTPFHAETDANGFYRIEDVFLGDWQVRAAIVAENRTTDGFVTVTSGGSLVNRDLYFDEPLPQGGIIGEVLDYDGTPVANALIHLSGGYLSTNWNHETTTDANGRFAIEGLAPGRRAVHAMKGNHGGIAWAELRFPGDTAWVSVRFRGGKVRIKTLEEDPISHELRPVVSEVAYRYTVVHAWGVVVLDSEYHYETTDPTTGVLELDVLAGPYNFRTWNAFHDEVKAVWGQIDYDGQVVEHTIIYQPNGVIRGTLFDVDGETPVEGARVELTGGSFSEYDVTTDAEGRFEFPLTPPGLYVLEAFHEDGAIFRQQATSLHLRDPGEEIDVELVLPEQGSVVGWVETFDGDPVPGAVVRLSEGQYPARQMVVNADEEGNFAFHNVFAGNVHVTVQAPELGGLGGTARFQLTSEGEEVVAAMTLEPVGEVTGRVNLPAAENGGAAVANASVWLPGVDSGNTDDAGEFRFRLLPLGWYKVQTWDSQTGRKGQSAFVEVASHGQVARADVVLETRGVVTGVFSDGETAQPIPGALIVARMPRGIVAFSSTDRDGVFELGGVPEGTTWLLARDAGGRRHASTTVTVQEEDEVVTADLTLEATSGVTGSVLTPVGVEDGLFPNANVWIVQDGVLGAGFDNPFAFDGLLANRRFAIWAQELGSPRLGVTWSTIDEAGQDVEVDVRMQALGSVTVEVEDSFGTPVPGTDIYVSNRHDYGSARFSASGDATSAASFNDVREGALWVRVVDPVSELRGSTTGELVTEGENVVLAVVLEDTGTVRGRVVRADGVTAAAFASASVLQGGRWFLGEADEDGNFSFSGVPMGSYTLVVQEADGLGQTERRGTLSANGQVDDYGVLVLDEVPPRVESITPLDGSRDLPLSTTVTITFSEPMDAARVTPGDIDLRTRNGVRVASTLQWNADQTAVTLVPDTPLESGSVYDVLVSHQVYDLAGRELVWRVRSSFYTADVIPPAVIDTLPRDGDTQVPVDTLLTVTFSEPVELASLSGTAVQMTDLTVGKGITTTVQLRPGEREIIVTPQIDPADPDFCGTELCPDRDVRLTVQGVNDLAGNVMAAPVSIVFWTPDETLPQMTWLTPAEGDVFTSGDTVSISIDATDNRGVGQADFSIASAVSGTWSATVTADGSPQDTLAWDVPAPIVDTTASVTITAVVSDVFGNSQTWTRTITVEPRANASAPELTSLCPVSGDLVAPGLEVPIPYTMSDDESLESLWLEVDGVVVEHLTPFDQPSAEDAFLWTPPAGTAAGTSFDVRVKARDFANNVTEHALVLQAPAGTLLVGDQVVDSSHAGQSLVLAAGTFTTSEALVLQDLRLLHGATLMSGAAILDLVVTATVHVQCGAVLTADATGYAVATGEPVGLQAPAEDSGGCHGGVGGVFGPVAPCEVYDSVYMPTLAGAGGGGASSGGAGGGVVMVTAAELAVDGELNARGETGARGSGGGGTVLADVGTLRGQGLIDASGGDAGFTVTGSGGFEFHGAGGGGRIAIYADDLSGIDLGEQARAYGGNDAASPGTVYSFLRGVAVYGALRLDGGTPDGVLPATPLPSLGTGGVASALVETTDLRVTGAAAFTERWLGAWMELSDAGGTVLGQFQVIEVDASGGVLLADAATASAAASYRGLYLFDEMSFGPGASFSATDPVDATVTTIEGESEVESEIVGDTLVVKSGASLRPVDGGSLHFMVDTLHVEAGAVIEVNGLGFAAATAPAGVTPSATRGGGSHGGVGQSIENAVVGEIFGSVYEPSQGGGGGGLEAGSGSGGGGVLLVEARVVVLDGELQARGGDNSGTASGAGGSVLVIADQMSGGGRIDVTGGPKKSVNFGQWEHYGGGGGGRVALHVGDLAGFDPVTQVWAPGGHEEAGLGTVLVRTDASTYGSLYLDGDGVDPIPTASLPLLGNGAVTLAEVHPQDGADLRLGRASAFGERWRGAWMELSDGGGATLGSFEVTDVDAAGRVRLAGAGAVAGAATYRGEYRFDEVLIESGVDFVPQDPVMSSTLVFEGESVVEGDVTADNVVLRAGATLRPASGGTLRLVVADTLTIEAGAAIDVHGLGYAGGLLNEVSAAPAGVGGSTTRAGGSHGGQGSFAGPGVPGGTYGSVYFPVHAGAGSGSSHGEFWKPGGAGGGAVEITAASVVLDGQILAGAGDDAFTSLGGAGGSVLIHTGSLAGSGTIDAAGAGPCRKAGGGGHVAIWAGTLGGFDPALQVTATGDGDACAGVDEYGGAGTIFVHGPASTWGDLRVRHAAASPVFTPGAARTWLPSIGKGTLGTVTPDSLDPADAWIEPADPGARFGVGVTGMWVRILGVDYPVIGESTDQRSLLLEGAAGAVAAGDVYIGLYKFDNVIVEGGAELVLRDDNEVTAWTVDAGSQVTELDVTPPVISAVTPAAGSLFSSGDTVTLDVTVTDFETAVDRVVFHWAGQTYTATAAPWSWTTRAPAVTVAGDSQITVEAFDTEDNKATAPHTFTLQPLVPGGAPAVAWSCPTVQLELPPGGGLDVVADASDPQGIERVELSVIDPLGNTVPVATDFIAPYTATVTMPATAVGGDVLTLRARATDYAGEATEVSIPVAVETRTLLAGDQILDSAWNGQDLFLGPGTYTVGEALDLAGLTLLSGAVVVPVAALQTLDIAAGQLAVHCNAAIDADGLGYAGGPGWSPGDVPAWVTPPELHAGGTHGGRGWSGGGASAEVFDSVYEPTLGGGGGSAYSAGNLGGDGGGIVRLEVTAGMVLEGEIRADGLPIPEGDAGSGGGSGGSVVLTAGQLTGGGRISATGADYQTSSPDPTLGSSGGGGRVALDVNDLGGFDPLTQVALTGGVRYQYTGAPSGIAAPGTLYVRTLGSTYGDLVVNGGGQPVDPGTIEIPRTDLPLLGSGAATAFEDDAGAVDAWLTAAAAFTPRWRGAWVELADVTGAALGTFRVNDVDAAGRLRLEGAAGTASATSWTGQYRFDNVVLLGGAGLAGSDVVAGGSVELRGQVELALPLVADALVARSGAVVWSSTDTLDIQASGTLEVESGAVLDMSGRGHAGGFGSGPGSAPAEVTFAGQYIGGSHGSLGWSRIATPPGELYDSVYQPILAGGGGGSYNANTHGGGGGGVIRLRAAQVVLNGELRADGTTGDEVRTGAGAGGTVRVEAGALSGSGTIHASGGDHQAGTYTEGGPGGGGRVALLVDDLAAFDVLTRVEATGGTRFAPDSSVDGHAGAGTVFVRDATAVFGSLVVDQRAGAGESVDPTTLPSIGRDVVANPTAAADPADLWIEPQDAGLVPDFGLAGTWLRVAGIDYPVAAQGSDRRTLLLDGAAGVVADGEAFEGYYKFDDVTVRGGARLELLDYSEVAVWDVEPGAEVLRPDQDPPVISAVTPAEGAIFSAGDAIAVTAEVSDPASGLNHGVAEVTLHFDGQSLVDSAAPYEWPVTAPLAAGNVLLTVDATDPSGNAAVPFVRTIQVVAADPPSISIPCPGQGVLLAPGTGLDVTVDAAHEHGIDRVELLVDGAAQATVTAAPYVHRVTAPATALAGQVLDVQAVAYSTVGSSAAAALPIGVVTGNVFTADATIAAGDLTYDGTGLVVAGGTLTFDGAHTFSDLVVLDGAVLTHSPTTAGAVGSLDLTVSGGVYVACGGAIDADGRGYGAGTGHPNDPAAGAVDGIGGSHGGRGGLFDTGTVIAGTVTSGSVYGSFADPADPGAGGGGANASAGGGVIRLVAADMTLDGAVTARGGSDGLDVVHGAGGSIRLDATDLGGLGTVDASGGGSSGASAGGGGGRVALYATVLDAGLLGRTMAHGGASTSAGATGAAGTVFVKRDTDPFGELHVVNHDLTGGVVASTQVTELPAAGAFSLDRVVVDGQATVVTLDTATLTSPAEVGIGSAWLPGYTPSLTITAPVAGSVLQPGQSFTVNASVDDVLGVPGITETFDGTADVDGAAPFSWSESAPVVGVQTSMPITVEATDLGGHPLSHAISVTVEPAAGNGPDVVPGGCPADQDLVTPGQTLTFPFTATDDELVTSWTLRVDGAVIETQSVAAASVAASPSWTVPAAALAGQSFTVRVEAIDQVGAIGVSQWQLSVPVSHLTGPMSLDAAWDGQDLVLGPGTFTVTEPLSLASLRLLGGAVVESPAAQDTVVEPLDLTIAGELHVQCGGAVDVSGLGYQGGDDTQVAGDAPAGLTPAGQFNGGSHASQGTRGYPSSSTLGDVYDSVYHPALPGGGGGRRTSSFREWGGNGGGVVLLKAQSVNVEGSILARGTDRDGSSPTLNTYAGAGAGGTVVIDADSLFGAGTIDASGGNYWRGGGDYAGVGGSGRVAILVDDLSLFDVAGQVSAYGGSHYQTDGTVEHAAAPGTIYVSDAGAQYGRLIIDGGAVAQLIQVPPTPLPVLGSALVTALSAEGPDARLSAATAFDGRWLGAAVRLSGAAGNTIGTFAVLEVDAGGDLLLANAAAAAGQAVSYQGIYRFDSIELRGGTGLDASDPVEGGQVELFGESSLPAEGFQATSLTVRGGARLGPSGPTQDGIPGVLNLNVSGTLTVEVGAAIDVTGSGYKGGDNLQPDGDAPDGLTASGQFTGGSHGGRGTHGYSTARSLGDVYDSPYQPYLPGGGGGHRTSTPREWGGSGGGAIILVAQTLDLEGDLLATGADRDGRTPINNDYAGTGAGGTVSIDVATLTGGGLIDASGGDYYRGGGDHGGLGGGGRVIVLAQTLSGFDPALQVTARGGRLFATDGVTIESEAAPGTLYAVTSAAAYGDLVVGRGPASGVAVPPTVLPSPGTGTVGTVAADPAEPANLWIEPSDPALLFDLGVVGLWLRVDGTDYRILAQTSDRRQLLLEGAAATVVGAEAYSGVYKLDTVTVRGGANLEFRDTAEITTTDVDADSTLTIP